ncbi:hypothetical protein [Lacinutrix algicola]|uniref:hypothetical protein n=1 Tax=Lacinutrix algicola TaxID=342954 RepID=UPI0006E1AC3D|nr:hypothetical protein [Lacinutrix algicola]
MRTFIRKIEFPVCEIESNVREIKKQVDCLRAKFNYDNTSLDFFNWLDDKVDLISKVSKTEVRFNYLVIQNEMDRLYKLDPTITGYNITFDFVKTNDPFRAKFNLLISKTN